MDEYLLAAITDLGSKLDTTNGLLRNIEMKLDIMASDVSSIESDTDDIYYIKSKIDDVISEIQGLH